MYALLVSVLKSAPEFAASHLVRIAKVAFGALTDKNKGNHVMAWDLLLTLLKGISQ